MNIYTFDIFTNYCIAVEEIDETDIIIGLNFHYLEIRPLNFPEPSHLNKTIHSLMFDVNRSMERVESGIYTIDLHLHGISKKVTLANKIG